MSLKVLDICSGIGGFSLGIIAADLHHVIEPTCFVEINPYCQGILNKWFPGVPVHDDLKTFNPEPGLYDLICAGFPCQPHSHAGSRKGRDDERNLWPDVLRVITKAQPIGFILENVPGIRHANKGTFLQEILRDIAEIGYDCQWSATTVAGLGGTHKRERFWLIAYPQSSRRSSIGTAIATEGRTDKTPISCSSAELPRWTQAISTLRKSDAGLSGWMVDRLLKKEDLPKALKHATRKATRGEVYQQLTALGNAVCPAQAATAWKKLYEQLGNLLAN